MQLWKDILIAALQNEEESSSFNEMEALFESVCYNALKRIKEIIEDDTLDDPECFAKIEEIVSTLEAIGSDGGARHDFG